MRVNIYIESSVKGPRRSNGVVGFVLEEESHKDKTLTQFGKVENVTANQAVLLALIHALRRIKTGTDITIWTDSFYIQSALVHGWLEEWSENGWKTAKGKEICNEKEWKQIKELLGDVEPEFEIGTQHPFKNYLKSEVERRAKRYV